MTAQAHSRVVTVLAWLLMLGSTLLLPISFFSALMLLVGSHGTENATLGGILLIVFGPAAMLLAGFGLWRRWRWAWAATLLLLAALLLQQVAGWWRGPTPERIYVSPSGTTTTVSASPAQYSLPLALVCALLLVFLLQPRVRAEFAARRPRPGPSPAPGAGTPPGRDAAAVTTGTAQASARGWRVGHRGRDQLFYEDLRGGGWQRIEIDGEMLLGEPHHAVYLASPERWQRYPAWARDRRDEIVARLRSELKEPGYVFQGETAPAAPRSREGAE